MPPESIKTDGGEWREEFDKTFRPISGCMSCMDNPCGYHTTGCRGDVDQLFLFGQKNERLSEVTAVKDFISHQLLLAERRGLERALEEVVSCSRICETASVDCSTETMEKIVHLIEQAK